MPHGRAPGKRDPGAWGKVPGSVDEAWAELAPEFAELCRDHPKLKNTNNLGHLGTLGTGNHFIELCLDEEGAVWVMLHSGSRGVGNAIGTLFIELAKQDAHAQRRATCRTRTSPTSRRARPLRRLRRAVGWAQDFARLNREVMMRHVIAALQSVIAKPFQAEVEAVNCHHNYVQREHHFGEDVFVTRKGAVARRPASSASSRAAWARAASSCAARATRRASHRARTARAGR